MIKKLLTLFTLFLLTFSSIAGFISASAINGDVAISPSGKLQYTPYPDFNGTDTITYKLSDGKGGYSESTVSVIVNPVNDTPIANDFSISLLEDSKWFTTVDFIGNTTDKDSSNLIITPQATTVNGYFLSTPNTDETITSLNYSYRPKPDWHGTEIISYTASDDSSTSNTAQVSIHVAPVNDEPTGTVSIVGIPQSGELLSASNDITDADGMGVVGYTWLDGANDLGTDVTYTLTDNEVGKKISVKASYIDNDGNAEAKISVETDPVVAKAVTNPAKPVLIKNVEAMTQMQASINEFGSDITGGNTDTVIRFEVWLDATDIATLDINATGILSATMFIDWDTSQLEVLDWLVTPVTTNMDGVDYPNYMGREYTPPVDVIWNGSNGFVGWTSGTTVVDNIDSNDGPPLFIGSEKYIAAFYIDPVDTVDTVTLTVKDVVVDAGGFGVYPDDYTVSIPTTIPPKPILIKNVVAMTQMQASINEHGQDFTNGNTDTVVKFEVWADANELIKLNLNAKEIFDFSFDIEWNVDEVEQLGWGVTGDQFALDNSYISYNYNNTNDMDITFNPDNNGKSSIAHASADPLVDILTPIGTDQIGSEALITTFYVNPKALTNTISLSITNVNVGTNLPQSFDIDDHSVRMSTIIDTYNPGNAFEFTSEFITEAEASQELYGNNSLTSNPSNKIIKLTLNGDMARVTDDKIYSIAGADIVLNLDKTKFAPLDIHTERLYHLKNHLSGTSAAALFAGPESAIDFPTKLTFISLNVATIPKITLIDNVITDPFLGSDRPSKLDIASFYIKPLTGVTSFNLDYHVEFSPNRGDIGIVTQTPQTLSVSINTPPVAVDDTASIIEDSTDNSIEVLANDVDAQGGISIKSVASDHGSVAIAAGKVIFTPTANLNGNATITYIVTDGEFDDTGTVNVSIAPVNDPVSGIVIISGIAQSGEILTASNTLTDVDGMGSVTYTWSDGTNNLGTDVSYTLTDTEVGKKITVKATYIDGDGNAEAKTSVETTPVEAKPVTNPAKPVLIKNVEAMTQMQASINEHGQDFTNGNTDTVVKFEVWLDATDIATLDANATSIYAGNFGINWGDNQLEPLDWNVTTITQAIENIDKPMYIGSTTDLVFNGVEGWFPFGSTTPYVDNITSNDGAPSFIGSEARLATFYVDPVDSAETINLSIHSLEVSVGGSLVYPDDYTVSIPTQILPPPFYFTTEVISATESSIELYGTDYSTTPDKAVIKLTLIADMDNVTDSSVYSMQGAEVSLNIDWSQFEAIDYGTNGSSLFEGVNVVEDHSLLWGYVASDLTHINKTLGNTKEPIKVLVLSIDTGNPGTTLVDNVETTGMGTTDRPSELVLGHLYLNPKDDLDSVDFGYSAKILVNQNNDPNMIQPQTSLKISTPIPPKPVLIKNVEAMTQMQASINEHGQDFTNGNTDTVVKFEVWADAKDITSFDSAANEIYTFWFDIEWDSEQLDSLGWGVTGDQMSIDNSYINFNFNNNSDLNGGLYNPDNSGVGSYTVSSPYAIVDTLPGGIFGDATPETILVATFYARPKAGVDTIDVSLVDINFGTNLPGKFTSNNYTTRLNTKIIHVINTPPVAVDDTASIIED